MTGTSLRPDSSTIFRAFLAFCASPTLPATAVMAHHLDLIGRGEGEQDGDGVVLTWVGIDDDLGRHGTSLGLGGFESPFSHPAHAACKRATRRVLDRGRVTQRRYSAFLRLNPERRSVQALNFRQNRHETGSGDQIWKCSISRAEFTAGLADDPLSLAPWACKSVRRGDRIAMDLGSTHARQSHGLRRSHPGSNGAGHRRRLPPKSLKS